MYQQGCPYMVGSFIRAFIIGGPSLNKNNIFHALFYNFLYGKLDIFNPKRTEVAYSGEGVIPVCVLEVKGEPQWVLGCD